MLSTTVGDEKTLAPVLNFHWTVEMPAGEG